MTNKARLTSLKKIFFCLQQSLQQKRISILRISHDSMHVSRHKKMPGLEE